MFRSKLLNGTRSITVTASAGGFANGADDIRIYDDETTSLMVDLPADAAEGDGLLSGIGVVSAGTAVDSDVCVGLILDDQSEIKVPDCITIPAGQTQAVFDVEIIDDTEFDGKQTVALTAFVPGWASGTDSIDISDNEVKEYNLELA